MTAPGNASIIIVLVLGIIVTSAYAIGRIQQWYLHGVRRDAAYRAGYDSASSLLLSVVANAAVPGKAAPPTPTVHVEHRVPARAARPDTGGGRQRQRATAGRGNTGSRHARLP